MLRLTLMLIITFLLCFPAIAKEDVTKYCFRVLDEQAETIEKQKQFLKNLVKENMELRGQLNYCQVREGFLYSDLLVCQTQLKRLRIGCPA